MGTTVDPVVDGMMRLFPAVLFPDVTDAEWDRHPELLDAGGMVELPYGAFVVRAPDHRVVLLDAGGGPGFTVPEHAGTLADGGRLLENLRRLGVRPSDVTDVVLSHLHVDHIGWAAVAGSPAFPSATYHCHAADLAHFLPAAGPPPDDRVPPLLAPVADLLRGWDGPATTVAGVRLLHTPGHTPGSSVALVGRPGNGLAVVATSCTARWSSPRTGRPAPTSTPASRAATGTGSPTGSPTTARP
ncbi:hypothetical protein BJF78_14450 [Pseudonocardia sp. CNS-139]|nr:hypothetical protein BJF78_14450 [Pseudonocardia sp. CNS-139]